MIVLWRQTGQQCENIVLFCKFAVVGAETENRSTQGKNPRIRSRGNLAFGATDILCGHPQGNSRFTVQIAFRDPHRDTDKGQDRNMPEAAGMCRPQRAGICYFAVPNARLVPGSMT